MFKYKVYTKHGRTNAEEDSNKIYLRVTEEQTLRNYKNKLYDVTVLFKVLARNGRTNAKKL